MTDAQKVDARREAKHKNEVVDAVTQLAMMLVWNDEYSDKFKFRCISDAVEMIHEELLDPRDLLTADQHRAYADTLDEIDRQAAANREGK